MLLLDVPVPPQLEAAAGWTGGNPRWLSICWSCCGDAPWLDDGATGMTGHPWGLLAWLRHPSVAPALADADLGSSEADGTERVLLDRRERRVYLAATAEARATVRGQWPAEEAVQLSSEEWDAVVARVRHAMLNRPIPSTADLMRQLREHSRVVSEMLAFLDRRRAGAVE